jgi:adenylate cyclase
MLDKNTEYELRFIVKGKKWKEALKGVPIEQRYISIHPDRTVRVRIYGEQSFLTIKGRRQHDMNAEFEWPIALEQAKDMFKNSGLFQGSPIRKIRYSITEKSFTWKGRHLTWSIDEFTGKNYPLQLAEIELNNLKNQQEVATLRKLVFDHLPDWIVEYIDTNLDPKAIRYNNIYLASHPFNTWTVQDKSSMMKYIS